MPPLAFASHLQRGRGPRAHPSTCTGVCWRHRSLGCPELAQPEVPPVELTSSSEPCPTPGRGTKRRPSRQGPGLSELPPRFLAKGRDSPRELLCGLRGRAGRGHEARREESTRSDLATGNWLVAELPALALGTRENLPAAQQIRNHVPCSVLDG